MAKLAVRKFFLDSVLETKGYDDPGLDDGLDRWERDEPFLDEQSWIFGQYAFRDGSHLGNGSSWCQISRGSPQ